MEREILDIKMLKTILIPKMSKNSLGREIKRRSTVKVFNERLGNFVYTLAIILRFHSAQQDDQVSLVLM